MSESPISLRVLEKLSEEELKRLVLDAYAIMRNRGSGKPTEPIPTSADNLFALLLDRQIKDKDIIRELQISYAAWQRLRHDLQKMSVTRVVGLAKVLQVDPVRLFEIILDSYPQTENGYQLNAYREQVARDLESYNPAPANK